MKTKRLAFVLMIVLVVSLSATTFGASNPFSDVPADHWAYDSIIGLAAVGLIEGYPDGTYGGSRMLTRYEAAMVFARTLARLEALVATEVLRNTADVQKQITANVLADIEGAKADLRQLVKDELAKIDIPVVTETIREQTIETVVEVQPIERPFILTPEAEAMIADFVGNLTQKQLDEALALAEATIAEPQVIERIIQEYAEVDEAVISAIVEQVLAESLVEITATIQNVQVQVDGLRKDLESHELAFQGLGAQMDDMKQDFHVLNALVAAIRGDVDGLMVALDAQVAEVANSVVALGNEFQSELALLGIRVDKLEMLYGNVDGRVTELESGLGNVEGRVTKVEGRVTKVEHDLIGVDHRLTDLEVDYVDFKTETERIKLSGSLKANIDKNAHDGAVNPHLLLMNDREVLSGVTAAQEVSLNLAVKPSEDMLVNVYAKLKGEGFGDSLEFDTYGVEVLSASPVTRLVAGTMDEDEVTERFSSYILNEQPEFGVLVDFRGLGIMGNTVLGREGNNDLFALSGKYSFVPAFNVKAQYGYLFDNVNQFDGESASLVSVYGTVYGVNYDAALALDQSVVADNRLYEVNLDSSFGGVAVNAAWGKAEDNFGNGLLSDRSFVENSETRLELGASASILGLSLAAKSYNEIDDTGANTVQATMFNAAYELEYLIPIQVSGAMGSIANVNHNEFKVGTSDLEIVNNLVFGTSFTIVRNWIDGNWKDATNWTGHDVNILAVDLGYGLNVNGAEVNLGYDLELIMPRGAFAALFGNQTAHSVKAGYSFDDTMKLNLSALQTRSLDGADNATNVQEVKAGLEFKF